MLLNIATQNIEDDVVGVMTRIATEIQNKFKALERV